MLVVAHQNAFVVKPNGNVTATIWRRFDRNWLGVIKNASVASDGQFALITGPGLWRDGSLRANIYNASGTAVRSVILHPTFSDYSFTFTGSYLATRKDNQFASSPQVATRSFDSLL